MRVGIQNLMPDGMTDARTDGVILRLGKFQQLNKLSAIAVSKDNFVEVFNPDI